MTRWNRYRNSVCIGLFTVIFITLAVASYVRESATWDEPYHLTAGYTALKLGDYRIDSEHPPFLRMWAALPLLGMPDIKLDTTSASWQQMDQWMFGHDFLYRQNDADRLLNRARFMMVLLGVALGVLLFGWASELFGFWPAAVLLALYTVEPNILAHARLVTTDMGATCFIFGSVYFLWRLTRRLSAGNLAGLTVFVVLAQVSKFSAFILGPVVVILLCWQVADSSQWLCEFRRWSVTLKHRRHKAIVAVMVVCLLCVASYGGIWAVYGFRYRPMPGISALVFRTQPDLADRVPAWSRLVKWGDRNQLLPNAYLQGLLTGQAKAQLRNAFLAGQHSQTGWWYYFPVAFLIKTPVTLLALFLAGLALARRITPLSWKDMFHLGVPLVMYGAMAVTSHLNIGLRHILPLYPFLMLVAGVAIVWVIRHVRRELVVVLPLMAALELATAYPHCLTFFNAFIGGPGNGYKWLVDSNLDWGQELKGLKRWMDQNEIPGISLCYFGTADPRYHKLRGIEIDTHRLDDTVRLPGYVAVSATYLQGVYLEPDEREIFAPLRALEPEVVLGNSLFVYWVERPWWK